MEDKVEKTPRQSSKKKKEFLKYEEILRNILENMKHNILIMGTPEEIRVSKGSRKYLKK